MRRRNMSIFPTTVRAYTGSEAIIERFGGTDCKRGICRILLGYWYHEEAARMGNRNSNFVLEMAKALVGFKRVVIRLECRRPVSDYSEIVRAGMVAVLEPWLGKVVVVWNVRYIRCVEFRPLDYLGKKLLQSGIRLEG